ncbi:type II toxin-antitoxin system RelE/ParE family toxin [Aquabacterium sp. OR-4]|uniref:type II toxin-antitoxin system RelE/ParE family toxin n=1 Tax=Aquabacterium sp. OR-4 TaxID=2978127 RepID=UPI0021B2D93E|nr:type II toxin-antitoxin system RelE/ParE family toxin [Aquabacterium sp. OR-4]MDT7834792.1 type II toxin-antitoxin system RelE/ParE family toxin [Aquabacterium sp. OR-4]
MSIEARKDLRAIVRWIAEHDSPMAATHVLKQVTRTYEGLATFPERGAYPPELLALGIHRYRQVHFKPYRIIYRVLPDTQPPGVLVALIADGRRDLTTLLERRLLAP